MLSETYQIIEQKIENITSSGCLELVNKDIFDLNILYQFDDIKNVTFLNVKHNSIKSFSGIWKYKNIKHISVGFNEIERITSLPKMIVTVRNNHEFLYIHRYSIRAL